MRNRGTGPAVALAAFLILVVLFFLFMASVTD